jgi:SAM-dependent methyltransferase
VCPACGARATGEVVERYSKYALHECGGCELQFWEPRRMPDGPWYEQVYAGRDAAVMPLEPGHRYFLSDARAPGRGRLLDIGCGTGNFLAAAQRGGYEVTGIELDANAARMAREHFGLQRVFALEPGEFARRYPEERFDVVTFFEVLEHQADPLAFLEAAKACLRPRGCVALSVPNRERWQRGTDALDYPPNHFLRWNAGSLARFFEANGFEMLTMREEPLGVRRAAQMVNTALRTGLTRPLAGAEEASFREVMQAVEEKRPTAAGAGPTMRQRVVRGLAAAKRCAVLPLAAAAWPVLRLSGRKGAYLYCLARLRGQRRHGEAHDCEGMS